MSEDLIFQITSWDVIDEEDEDDFEDNDNTTKYIIRAFGTDLKGKKIYMKTKGFTPFFYVCVPKDWRKDQEKEFVKTVSNKVSKKHQPCLKKWDTCKKHKFESFTNYSEFKFIRLIFTNYDAYKAYRRVLEGKITSRSLSQYPKRYKLYESNIEPLLRFIHIRDIEACGWIKIKKNKYEEMEEEVSYCDRNINVKWTDIYHYDIKTNSKLIIASFDIECESGDGSFPQPQRDSDRVIQIGTTFNYYGETECFYKHIVTLNSCDKIEGVDVESYTKERDVLIAWTKLIQRIDPDIITGYNIFGFDYKYLKTRSMKLGCAHKFSELGRIKGEQSKFIEKSLASSALGDNMLYYYDMVGRVQIDLMKVIQREYKLGSYKLDNVASTFIRENISKLTNNDDNTISIETKSTYGLAVDRYIKIYYNDGLSDNSYHDNMKFRILELKDNYIKVEGVIDHLILNPNKDKVFWCQAKDDVKPRELFELQKGTSKDRARIASYCIQDAALCNKILEKLQIVTNNISMSNVCHVPLSYIFLRGQTIKSFSLVAKKCRLRNHLIPVKKKQFINYKDKNAKDKKENETKETFDGAEVFNPTTGIHMGPISVLDYGSLYPSSMIHRNTSHECIVLDDKYKNLPDYDYYDVTYTLNDVKTTSTFVKSKKGRIGIIPEILQELLSARSRTKKLMAIEKDPFKKNILNGLQLAFKITANSLYGLLGSSVSPLCMIALAASITATGKEMLNCAKIFAEKIFPLIINPAIENNYDTYDKNMNLMFDKKINELLGKKTINKLKASFSKNDDSLQIPWQSDYYYLRIFQEKKDEITDCDFVSEKHKKLGINRRIDYIKYIFHKIQDLFQDKNINTLICVYGDTDSIFVDFNLRDYDNNKLVDLNALDTSIKLGIICGDLINYILPKPQNLEYEKTFWPWISLSKKRYVGNLYEFDSSKFYQKNMGIVLIRRDNAPIVKIVIGGIVDKVLNERSVHAAVEFTKIQLSKILSGKYNIDKFIITKTLKGDGLTEKQRILEQAKDKEDRKYVDRTNIVHAALADRMADRDPGNKPQSNDRIPYVFVVTDNKSVRVQGDRVEHPDYVIENNIKLDYLFYITNQIMKPAIQFLGHMVKDPEKIFKSTINRELNRRKGKRPITFYAQQNESNNNSNNDSNNNEIDFEDI